MANSLFEIPLQTIAGQPTSLSSYQGKVLLIVNVASQCGFTPQYTGLESLYKRYKDQGLVVLGFPANDFGNQEPGTNAEIERFCSTEFPVTFPLFSKSSVVGQSKNPVYAELIAAQPSRISDGNDLHNHLAEYAAENNLPAPNAPPEILWNFEKFLIGRDGRVIARYASDIEPNDPRILKAIETALAQS